MDIALYIPISCCMFVPTGWKPNVRFVRFFVGVGSGGVGWANNVHLHLHSCVTLGYCRFSCTCRDASRSATAGSLALARMCHATLLWVLLHLHTYVMLCYCTFSCICTKRNNPDWMIFWFGDTFLHGNGAGKQMLLDLPRWGLAKRCIFRDAFYSEYATIPT